MYVKIQTSDIAEGNTNSCRRLCYYLEKENIGKSIREREYFFSHSRDSVHVEQVIEHIDKNAKGHLLKTDAKFYSVVLAPSEQELEHIGNDSEKLKEYTRAAMQAYAENFNKGLNSQDLVWYAKIEHNRQYRGDTAIEQNKKSGEQKEGLQTHIHIIVSRKDVTGKKKLSPLANERGKEYNIGGNKIVKGFDRDKYKETCERLFDEKFAYHRPEEESYLFYKKVSKATSEERIALFDELDARNTRNTRKTNQSQDQEQQNQKQIAKKKNITRQEQEKEIERIRNVQKIHKTFSKKTHNLSN